MNERYAQALAERDMLDIQLHDSDAELRRRHDYNEARPHDAIGRTPP
jgi:hypothetical protein